MIAVLKKITLFGCFILLTACIKQDNINTLVPDDIKIDFSVTAAFIPQIGTPYVRFGQGYNANGIVLFNYGQNQFRAFDLTCPTECLGAMDIDPSGIMTCKDCNNEEISFTQYQTTYTGKSTTYSLKEYFATLEGGVVRITNF